MTWLLDDAFGVPGTRLRFGLEPVVGLVPWLGDLVSAAFGLWIVVEGARAGLPRVVVGRMLVNSLLDLTVGAIPLLGDAFDFVYKSNTRNLRLLQRFADDPDASTREQWLFVAVALTILAGALLVVAVVLGALLDLLGRVLTL